MSIMRNLHNALARARAAFTQSEETADRLRETRETVTTFEGDVGSDPARESLTDPLVTED
jgi:hypothetical protein